VTITARAIKTGNITAAATSALATDAGGSSATLFLAQGSQGALAVISGTWTATLQFEGRAAGGTWFAVPAVAIGTTGGALASSTTANGNFLIAAVGVIELRVRCSAFTSGPAVVELSNAVIGGFSLPVTGTAIGTGAQQVQGTAADGAAAVGNPVQIGGVDGSGNAQAALVTAAGAWVAGGSVAPNGSTAGVGNPVITGWVDTNAGLVRQASSARDQTDTGSGGTFLPSALMLYNAGASQFPRVRDAASAANTTGTGLLAAAPLLFDETNYQLQRGNTILALLASATRTGNTTTANQTSYNAAALILVLTVTANPGGAQTLTLSLSAVIGGTSYTINTGIANAFGGGAGSSILVFGRGAATAWTGGTEHLTFQTAVPQLWTATVAHSAGGNWTYRLDAALVN
jgi:hypothetical protein